MRLLTYNIHKGVGGGDRRYLLDRIIDVIGEEDADLICLQEVDYNVSRSSFHDQPTLISRALKTAAHVYQLNVPHREGGYGNLLLSRWPINKHHHVSLRLNQRKPRGAQLAVVESPHGNIHLVNWHLGLVEKERRWQAGHLLHHGLFKESGHLPTLIAGDSNDWRNTLDEHTFQAHNFRQVTAPIKEFRSFPAFWALASLDKVFYRGPLEIKDAHIVRTKLARRASDHLPLVIDFHLRKEPHGHGHGHGHQHGHGHRG
jgi:endonuclease/exonuclease/phosphatase family metal-dependent hydrolase